MSVPAETHGGDVTSWIPLETVFTPSSGCETILRLNGPSLVAFDPGYGLDIDTEVKCAPSAVTTWWEQARLGIGGGEHTAVSIQPLRCPHEWTTVATYITGTSSTQIMCCPSGYSLNGATSGPVNGDCISEVPEGRTLTYASTAATAPTNWHTATTTLDASSSLGAIAIVGYNVQRDVSALSSSPSQSLSNSESLSQPSQDSSLPTSDSLPSSTNFPGSSEPPNNGLSTGTKAGIGVGVAVGVIGLAALIFAIFMLQRRNKEQSGGSPSGRIVAGGDSEYIPTGVQHDDPQKYAQTNLIYELHNHSRAQELPSEEVRSPVEIGNRSF